MAERAAASPARAAPRVIVAGATGFAGALAAHLLWRHPAFELVARDRPLGARAGASRTSTRATACRSTIERLDLDARSSASTRRSSPTRTPPPRRPSRRCASAARASSTSAPTSACASLETYERWYGEHPRPELIERGRLRAHRAAPRADRRCGDRRQPRLLPDRVAARARAARARRADRRRRDRRQAGHLRRRARLRRAARTSRWRARTSSPTRSPRTATRRRSRSSSRLLGSRRCSVQFQAHLVPLDQGELASCYVTPTRERRQRPSCAALFAEAYADEPFVEVVGRAARHARGARDELLPHLRRRRRAHRQGARVLGDRQPLEGHLLAGRAEPQRDVRPREAEGLS